MEEADGAVDLEVEVDDHHGDDRGHRDLGKRRERTGPDVVARDDRQIALGRAGRLGGSSPPEEPGGEPEAGDRDPEGDDPSEEEDGELFHRHVVDHAAGPERATEVEDKEPAENEPQNGSGREPQEPAPETLGHPQHDHRLDRPTRGHPLAGEDQRHRDRDEERRQAEEGDDEFAVDDPAGKHDPDVSCVESGHRHGEEGDRLTAVRFSVRPVDHPAADGEEHGSVEEQREEIEEIGLYPTDDLEEERGCREENEVADEEREHIPELLRTVEARSLDRRDDEPPRADEGEHVDQRPVLPEAEPEDTAAENEQVGEQRREARRGRFEHERRRVAADDPENGNEHRVEDDRDPTSQDRDEHHQGKGGNGIDEIEHLMSGKDREVEGGKPSPHQTLTEGVVAAAEEPGAADEHPEACDHRQADAGGGPQIAVVDRILQKEADAEEERDHADPQQPLAGDGKLRRHPLRHMLLADDDPVPDFPERLLGGLFKWALLPRWRRGPCRAGWGSGTPGIGRPFVGGKPFGRRRLPRLLKGERRWLPREVSGDLVDWPGHRKRGGRPAGSLLDVGRGIGHGRRQLPQGIEPF